MGFNFGAFLGGMSQQISSNIEDAKKFNREKEFRLEMLAEEEATKMRLAKASERREQRKRDKENASVLKAMGYTDAQAGWIMQGGNATVQLYSDFAQKAYARGINPADILETNLINSDQQDPRNESALMSVIDSTRPEPEVDEDNPFTVSQDIMTSVLSDVKKPEKPKEYATLVAGHSAAVTRQIDAQFEHGIESEEYKAATAVVEEWKKRIENAPERIKATDDKWFTDSSREAVIKGAFAQAYGGENFTYDLDTQVVEAVGGREADQRLAELKAAEIMYLESTRGDQVDDPLRQRANLTKNMAIKELETYGKKTVDKVFNPDQYVTGTLPKALSYFKNDRTPEGNITVNSFAKELDKSSKGRYKTGDVIIVEELDMATGRRTQRIKVYIEYAMASVQIGDKEYLDKFVDAGEFQGN